MRKSACPDWELSKYWSWSVNVSWKGMTGDHAWWDPHSGAKIISRAAFGMICRFCNKLQGKQALNKLHAGHETGLFGCTWRRSPEVLPDALAIHCDATHAFSLPLIFSNLNTPKTVEKQWSWQCRHPQGAGARTLNAEPWRQFYWIQ